MSTAFFFFAKQKMSDWQAKPLGGEGGAAHLGGMKAFAKKLAWAMERKGLDQGGLDAAARVRTGLTHNWVNGKFKESPKADQVFAVARALDVPIEWLMDDAQTGPPPAPDLTDIERLVLNVVRRLGPEEAFFRLTGAPARDDAGEEEQSRGVKTSERRSGGRSPKHGPS